MGRRSSVCGDFVNVRAAAEQKNFFKLAENRPVDRQSSLHGDFVRVKTPIGLQRFQVGSPSRLLILTLLTMSNITTYKVFVRRTFFAGSILIT